MKYHSRSAHFSDETLMKIPVGLAGLVGATSMLSVGAFAQHVSGGEAHGAAAGMLSVGGGHIPAHGHLAYNVRLGTYVHVTYMGE